MSVGGSPLRVILVNDYELVIEGLVTMLEPYSDRVVIVGVAVDELPGQAADVALFDTFAGRKHALRRLRAMVADSDIDRVALYTWDLPDQFASDIEEAGVDGVILKSTTGSQLVAALERICDGRGPDPDSPTTAPRASLTEREREVLAMLAQGLSNREVADELYLSVDTVKTHVRKLFRKLGVANRTQAAMSAAEHGVARRPTSSSTSAPGR